MGKQSKVEKAIRAARKRLDAGEYIGAVKAVRERYPERGLKGARDFTDWVRSNDEENATGLAGTWCEECWDILPCRIGVNHPRPTKTKATPLPENLSAKCKCGDPTCTNPWHYLARWMEQPGNYAKLQAWLRGEKVESVPLQ